MAFGYEFFKGRHGVSGHAMESGGKKIVQIRGLEPGERVELFCWGQNTPDPVQEKNADGSGHASFSVKETGNLFAVRKEQVALWQGGEREYFLASEWLRREKKKQKELPQAAPSPQEKREEPPVLPAKERQNEEKEPNENGQSFVENDQEEPEPAWTLRPASGGEPVDALPDRLDDPGKRFSFFSQNRRSNQ